MTPRRAPIDFDQHSSDFARDHRAAWGDLIERCPVAWSDSYGGFWVVSDYENVAKVARDDDTFSSRNDADPDSIYRGIQIPDKPGRRSIPIELDPPEFLGYRRLLMPYFSPGAVQKRTDRIQEIADALVDRVIETGRIDLVHDFAGCLPAIVTMELLGFPTTDWERYARPIHEYVYTPPSSPDRDRVVTEFMAIKTSVAELVRNRRASRRDDFVSFLIGAEVNGERLSDETVVDICGLVISGGVDTTSAVTANALNYLEQDPAARKQLGAQPDLQVTANEEFLRYFTPVQALARTVVQEARLGDQSMSVGDRVLVCWAGANQDPSEFPEPHEMQLDRTPNRHTAFGLGIHRCIGSALARAQMTAMIRTVLDRMPDYVIEREAVQRYESIGQINGFVSIPATFTPGPRLNRGTI